MFRDKEYLQAHSIRPHKCISSSKRDLMILGTIYDEIENNNKVIDVKIYNTISELCKKYSAGYSSIKKAKEFIRSFLWSFNWKITKEVAQLCDPRDSYRDFIVKQKKEKKKKEKNSKGGIYGIYVEDQLIYIGMTQRDFNIRWQEHKDALLQNDNSLFLYRWLKQNNIHKILFKKIIDLDSIEFKDRESNISKNELKSMEFALIYVLKPVCNLSGNSLPYNWG